ncbi:hypothetical protein OCH239_17185 [Roseivivax halodurans JCM 10272]|uniref:Mobilization protein n=1 Tax=Roseivivax halodurans JCM 10272 TaxID=1449350 RepID=X7EA82_9RHOB|nr:hypothetical protein [Roseivivax halodurans]ETX12770.1 hypothetical protein OCH239_17185 [Roseivivax halodurans JCM 10272]
MSERRDQVIKLRLTQAERAQLDRLCEADRSESCAAYIRQKALAPDVSTTAIAELIGRTGLTLNMLDTATPLQLGRLSADLRRLTAELRKHRAD